MEITSAIHGKKQTDDVMDEKVGQKKATLKK